MKKNLLVVIHSHDEFFSLNQPGIQVANLSDVGIVGDAKMVECIEESAQTCKFGVPFGLGVLCKCLLRNYITKHFTR